MKSVLVSGAVFVTLIALGLAQTVANVNPSAVATEKEFRGHHGNEGQSSQYHYSGWGPSIHHGTELFSGDEWLLAIPLILIPLIALACWYFWGGKGHDDGWGWDRSMARGADSLPKMTHQRIFNAIDKKH